MQNALRFKVFLATAVPLWFNHIWTSLDVMSSMYLSANVRFNTLSL